ncbi:MAG: GntR family transcriptional regulator [Parachlamydia sp.]|nr:GntR family transcriptional regulator [Parachlamydia sp.]
MDNENLREIARKGVMNLILEGQIKPGERLKESALSAALQVSRTPLREALIALESAGIVLSKPNIGFTLKPMSIQEAEELYALMPLLEIHALTLAFPFVIARISELEAINKQFIKQKNHPKEASLADRDFHCCLIALCRSPLTLQMIEELRLRISCYEHHYMAKSELIEISYAHHQSMIQAIIANNLKSAKEILFENWDYGKRYLIAELSS